MYWLIDYQKTNSTIEFYKKKWIKKSTIARPDFFKLLSWYVVNYYNSLSFKGLKTSISITY